MSVPPGWKWPQLRHFYGAFAASTCEFGWSRAGHGATPGKRNRGSPRSFSDVPGAPNMATDATVSVRVKKSCWDLFGAVEIARANQYCSQSKSDV